MNKKIILVISGLFLFFLFYYLGYYFRSRFLIFDSETNNYTGLNWYITYSVFTFFITLVCLCPIFFLKLRTLYILVIFIFEFFILFNVKKSLYFNINYLISKTERVNKIDYLKEKYAVKIELFDGNVIYYENMLNKPKECLKQNLNIRKGYFKQFHMYDNWSVNNCKSITNEKVILPNFDSLIMKLKTVE